MTKALDVVLRSDFPPETCKAKLASEIDVDRWTLFSLSGNRVGKPILGSVEADAFRLHSRRYWHNSWGPVLFERIMADGRGTRVEA